MKKYFVLLFTALVFCSFTNNNAVDSFVIAGKWENANPKDKGSGFIFESDGFIYMYKGTQKIGGKNFDLGGAKVDMKYAFDKKSNPMKLDIIVSTYADKSKTKKVLMLLKVIDNNTIDIATDGDGEVRTSKFTKENTIRFKRLK